MLQIVGSESKVGDSLKSHSPNMHAIKYPSYGLDDGTIDCSIAEFVWHVQAKPIPCSSLNRIHKNRQYLITFTFYVSEYD